MRLKPATAQTAPFEKLRREEEKEEEENEESQEEIEMENLVEEDKEYYYYEDTSNIGEVSMISTYYSDSLKFGTIIILVSSQTTAALNLMCNGFSDIVVPHTTCVLQ